MSETAAGGGAPIVMPKLGLTMTEGLLAAWKVAPGDSVRAGDVLFVVETEKIATDVESPCDGRIGALVVAEGDVVPVGAVLATWDGGAAAPSFAAPAPAVAPSAPPQQAAGPVAAPREAGGRIVATPLARKIARGAGLDLSAVPGSGPRGRIKAQDVEAALAARPLAPAPAAAAPVAPAEGIRRPASAIEKVVARRLTEAKQTIPHFYVQAEADITRLLALREELNAVGVGPRLSLTHFVVTALGRALGASPEMNVAWGEGETILALPGADVGLAVDTERGLLVPVIRRADALGVDGVARAAGALVDKARQGRLEAGDLAGGAISLSNVGMFGASRLAPIINPGQSAILGVAAVKPAFRPDGAGQPMLVQELGLVLSCDHRVLDGVKAARFLDRVVGLLERPLALLRTPEL